jgi:hypothetical protein
MCQEIVNEIWKPIIGYEGLYEISNYGKVKSLIRKGRPKERFLIQTDDNNGYLNVTLYKNKNPKTFKVHKLVLLTFIGKCPENKESCHNDGNRYNNFIGNLRYDTRKNNAEDRIKHGTSRLGMENNKAKFNNEQIIEIRKSNLKTIELAKKYNVERHAISNIKNRKTWRHINEK